MTWRVRALLVMLVMTTACRVNYSFTGADIPVGARTVSVELFDTRAPLAPPLASQILTEALRDLLQAQTPLNLTKEVADLQYSGALMGYDVQPVAIQANESAALNRLTLTATVSYVNTLDVKKNSDLTVSRFADFDSNSDLAQVEDALVREISDQLVQDIFDRTLGSW